MNSHKMLVLVVVKVEVIEKEILVVVDSFLH
jgi:hypothetical protein